MSHAAVLFQETSPNSATGCERDTLIAFLFDSLQRPSGNGASSSHYRGARRTPSGCGLPAALARSAFARRPRPGLRLAGQHVIMRHEAGAVLVDLNDHTTKGHMQMRQIAVTRRCSSVGLSLAGQPAGVGRDRRASLLADARCQAGRTATGTSQHRVSSSAEAASGGRIGDRRLTRGQRPCAVSRPKRTRFPAVYRARCARPEPSRAG